MFEIIAIIAVVLAIAIAIVLILAATKPNTLRVQRTTTVKAPPENIFPLINDFHRWGTWSPYETKDPAIDPERDESLNILSDLVNLNKGPTTASTTTTTNGH